MHVRLRPSVCVLLGLVNRSLDLFELRLELSLGGFCGLFGGFGFLDFVFKGGFLLENASASLLRNWKS
jgi:hypothetical protein